MKLQKLLLAIALTLTPCYALAGQAVPLPSASLIAKYPDLFAWVFGVVVVAVVGLIAMKVQADAEKARADSRNNEKQWQHIEKTADGLSKVKVDVAELRGAHEANHPAFRRS